MLIEFPHTDWYVKVAMSRKAATEANTATRDALVLAATAEMAQHGLDNASLDAICARAGFTRGAFYVHFRDRDELVAAVVERVIAHNQLALLGDEASAPDLRTTILRFIARVVGGEPTAVGTPAWRFRHTLAACARVPAVRSRYLALQTRGIELVAGAVRAGQKAGTVRDDVAAPQLAEILVAISLGISAAVDLGLPLDLLAGGAALERLLATHPAPRRRRARRRRA
jgi:TetR/AcrR family transcriptional repressor of nem operon